MRHVAIALATATLLACGSSTVVDPGPEQDKGITGGGEGTVQGTEKNPYGVDYPKDGIGTSVGARIQNFKFLGYVNGDKSQGLKTISLADFFDPETRQYKLVHLQAAGVWCAPCNEEMKMAAPLSDTFKSKKILWLTTVAEGRTPGVASTTADLDEWLSRHKAPFSQALDPNNNNLGVFYDRAAIPWNADIDARTMRILSASTGAPPNATALMKELDDRLKEIDSTPAK